MKSWILELYIKMKVTWLHIKMERCANAVICPSISPNSFINNNKIARTTAPIVLSLTF